MKKLFCLVCGVALLSSAAMAQDKPLSDKPLTNAGKISEPMARLTKAYILISSEQFDEAVKELLWAYDKGASLDKDFEKLRNTMVTGALGEIMDVYPKALPAIQARRDFAAKEVGTPPTIGPAFFDLLALNRAIGDEQANEALIVAAHNAGAVERFGGKSSSVSLASAPKPPTEITRPEIKARVNDARTFTQVSSCTDVKTHLQKLTAAAEADKKLALEQQKALQDQILAMQKMLETAKPDEQDHIIAKMRELVNQVRTEIYGRQAQIAKELAYYNDLLKWCESISSSPTKSPSAPIKDEPAKKKE